MHRFFSCKQYGKTAVINLQGSIKLKIKEGMQSVEISLTASKCQYQ